MHLVGALGTSLGGNKHAVLLMRMLVSMLIRHHEQSSDLLAQPSRFDKAQNETGNRSGFSVNDVSYIYQSCKMSQLTGNKGPLNLLQRGDDREFFRS